MNILLFPVGFDKPFSNLERIIVVASLAEENLRNLKMLPRAEMCLMKNHLLMNSWLYQILENRSRLPSQTMWLVLYLFTPQYWGLFENATYLLSLSVNNGLSK